MNEQKYVHPKYLEIVFNCPLCDAYALHKWYLISDKDEHVAGEFPADTFFTFRMDMDEEVAISECLGCEQHSFWVDRELVYPRRVTAPRVHADMPEDIVHLYNEARQISADSPGAAATLLRVVAAKICEFHGEEVRDLNEAIGNLSKKKFFYGAIQSLDLIRLLGNKGAHEGRIDLTGKDDLDVVNGLFWLVNFIIEKTISEPVKIEELAKSLSEGQRQQLIDRDQKDNAE